MRNRRTTLEVDRETSCRLPIPQLIFDLGKSSSHPCTEDRNALALTTRIHAAILAEEILSGKMISVVRPAK